MPKSKKQGKEIKSRDLRSFGFLPKRGRGRPKGSTKKKKDPPENAPAVRQKDSRSTKKNDPPENAPPANMNSVSVGSVSSLSGTSTSKPTDLVEVYKKDRSNVDAQNILFDHMTNFVAQQHWNEDYDFKPVQPSAYLDVQIGKTQRRLLNPSHKQVLTGFILYDCKGKGAIQKVAKRRLDMVSGNIASYSRVMNDPKRLKQVVEMNELTAAVAEVSADLAIEKDRKKKEREEEAKKKRDKVRQKKEKQLQAMREAMPGILNIMKAFEKNELDCTAGNLSKFTAAQLRNVLKYYFNCDKGLQKMSKADLTAKVAELYAKHGAQEHEMELADNSSSD